MIHAEWMINMIDGPVIGSADRALIDDAWQAIEDAFRDAVGEAWTPVHAAAIKRLEQHIMHDFLLHPQTTPDRVEYRVPGVSVVLTRISEPQ